jgi:hypothetical protein
LQLALVASQHEWVDFTDNTVFVGGNCMVGLAISSLIPSLKISETGPVCVLTEPRDLRSVNLAFGDQRKPR